MLKRFVLMIFAFALLFVSGNFTYAGDAITVKVDGQAAVFPDAQPYINEDGRTMVPVRFLSSALGASVDWSGKMRLVSIMRGKERIALIVGESEATVSGEKSTVKKQFDTRAVIKQDRTFVPLRFISETLGAGVGWDPNTRTVIIRTDGTVENVPLSPYEDFELGWTVGTKPADYIAPHFRVVHTPESESGYFSIEFVNFWDYESKDPDTYYYKNEFLNAPKLNSRQGLRPDGTSGDILDVTKPISISYLCKLKKNKNVPTYICGLPRMWYTTLEWGKYYKIKSGIELSFKITFSKGKYQEVYLKNIKVRDNL